MSDFFLALGGGDEIGASCYLLSIGGAHLLIDAGMRFQPNRAFPDFTRLNPLIGGLSEIDAVLLTHAHLDHCGALTRVQYEAPCTPKYSTEPTLALAEVMLRDSLRGSRRNDAEDWYLVEVTRHLADDLVAGTHTIEFGQQFCIGAHDVRATAMPAGHILGAASYLIESGDRRVLHTGDIALHDQQSVMGATWADEIGEVDILIIESTYAYQPTYHSEDVAEQRYELAEKIAAVINRGGRVLIPAFALGRAQEIAALLGNFFEQGVVPPFPVRLDGLVRPVADLYDRYRAYTPGRLKTRAGHAIYTEWIQPMPDHFYPTARAVRNLEPTCIIASSGMLLDRTRSAEYALGFLPNPEDAVLFSGYLDDESPGQRVAALIGGQGEAVVNRTSVHVRAEIGRYHLSAHASTHDLRRLIVTVKPRTVILIHGDPRYDGDADFIGFLLELERQGIHVHHAANGVPIYL